jgi:hypothetical protein
VSVGDICCVMNSGVYGYLLKTGSIPVAARSRA